MRRQSFDYERVYTDWCAGAQNAILVAGRRLTFAAVQVPNRGETEVYEDGDAVRRVGGWERQRGAADVRSGVGESGGIRREWCQWELPRDRLRIRSQPTGRIAASRTLRHPGCAPQSPDRHRVRRDHAESQDGPGLDPIRRPALRCRGQSRGSRAHYRETAPHHAAESASGAVPVEVPLREQGSCGIRPNDGKDGSSKLQPSTSDEEKLSFFGPKGEPILKPGGDVPISIKGRKCPISQLVSILTFIGTYGPGVDKTDLTGEYDFTLAWDEENGPGLGTALRDQLGLRMEAQKVPVSTLVVDSAQKPSAN
jgi:hypothetical protein